MTTKLKNYVRLTEPLRAFSWAGPAQCPECKIGQTWRLDSKTYKCLRCGCQYDPALKALK